MPSFLALDSETKSLGTKLAWIARLHAQYMEACYCIDSNYYFCRLQCGVLKATESWAGPGNEVKQVLCVEFSVGVH